MSSIPPFWLFAIAALVLIFLMAEFPRAGGALLAVLVFYMLILGKSEGRI